LAAPLCGRPPAGRSRSRRSSGMPPTTTTRAFAAGRTRAGSRTYSRSRRPSGCSARRRASPSRSGDAGAGGHRVSPGRTERPSRPGRSPSACPSRPSRRCPAARRRRARSLQY